MPNKASKLIRFQGEQILRGEEDKNARQHGKKCGKKLTDPESMRRGYGPECWSQISGISTADSGGVGNEADLPGQMTIFDFPDAIPRGEQNE